MNESLKGKLESLKDPQTQISPDLLGEVVDGLVEEKEKEKEEKRVKRANRAADFKAKDAQVKVRQVGTVQSTDVSSQENEETELSQDTIPEVSTEQNKENSPSDILPEQNVDLGRAMDEEISTTSEMSPAKKREAERKADFIQKNKAAAEQKRLNEEARKPKKEKLKLKLKEDVVENSDVSVSPEGSTPSENKEESERGSNKEFYRFQGEHLKKLVIASAADFDDLCNILTDFETIVVPGAKGSKQIDSRKVVDAIQVIRLLDIEGREKTIKTITEALGIRDKVTDLLKTEPVPLPKPAPKAPEITPPLETPLASSPESPSDTAVSVPKESMSVAPDSREALPEAPVGESLESMRDWIAERERGMREAQDALKRNAIMDALEALSGNPSSIKKETTPTKPKVAAEAKKKGFLSMIKSLFGLK